jgi:hypothetical protein
MVFVNGAPLLRVCCTIPGVINLFRRNPVQALNPTPQHRLATAHWSMVVKTLVYVRVGLYPTNGRDSSTFLSGSGSSTTSRASSDSQTYPSSRTELALREKAVTRSLFHY